MLGIHTITAIEKVNSQNCRLKGSIANYQIQGIVFHPTTGRWLLKVPTFIRESNQDASGKRPSKVLADTLLIASRIRGLTIQRTL